MIDIHNHLLPGLDDGSPDLKTSVTMARMAADDGITHIIATPHSSHRYTFTPELIADRLHDLRDALAKENVPLTVASGCDFHLSYDNIQDALQHPRRYTLNETEYLLVELPDLGLSKSVGETLYELRLAGMTPILTHPERNPTLQRDPSRLAEWLRSGLLTQITTSSITGKMGKDAERLAHKLLADRWVHFLSTDAHNLTTRPPQMHPACEVVTSRYGTAYAQRLCLQNPLAVFEGKSLPEQEQPLHLFDEYEDRGRHPWWKRLFIKPENRDN